MLVVAALMEIFVWWEALIGMKVEWRCALTTSGGQCVMMAGSSIDATVVCKQLGYAYTGSEYKGMLQISTLFHSCIYFAVGTGGIAYSNAHFGAGTGSHLP